MKKTKKFTPESYSKHLKAQGKDSSKVIDNPELAHEMAEAGDYGRTKASAIRKVGEMLIRSAETSKRQDDEPVDRYPAERGQRERHNSLMLAHLAHDVAKRSTGVDVAEAVRYGPYATTSGYMSDEEAVVLKAYSKRYPEDAEALGELYERYKERSNEERNRFPGLRYKLRAPTVSDVASSIVLPRREDEGISRHLEGLSDEEQKEVFRESPSWDYRFPFSDEEIDETIDKLVAERSRALLGADTDEDRVKYRYEESRLEKQKPSKTKERLSRFN
jgi:hypothetical protein